MRSLKNDVQHINSTRLALIDANNRTMSSIFRMSTSTIFSQIPSFLDWQKMRKLILELESEEP